ncbi:aminopeptidase P family N-terminal domain-containing protein [Enterococcus sp. LJL120]
MKITSAKQINLTKIQLPELTELKRVALTDETLVDRKEKVLNLMKKKQLDSLVIYADLEHGGNFEYLTGFVPRFEEALLVLHQDGRGFLLLGNENLNKADKARLSAKAIHVPYFSLPNQPMTDDQPLTEYLVEADLKENTQVGLVGWKLFTSNHADNQSLFEVPYYLVAALKNVIGEDNLSNETGLFIDSSQAGARTQNNANEIAHYAFGAQLAGQGIFAAVKKLQLGVSEFEIGGQLNQLGQPNSVVTIAAFGERFKKANLYPTEKKLTLGETISLTVGYKGGLSSRAGYGVHEASELPEGQQDYLETLAKPYFATVVTWLENLQVGQTGAEVYQLIEEALPKATYHWHLNPGHLAADEEWLSSPIYPNSTEVLTSGMLLQLDIIPSMAGYAGASCESTLCLADEKLQNELKASYPMLWQAIQTRRAFLKAVLGIQLSPQLLPLSDTVALYSPFMLQANQVLTKKM